jgi:phage/plasmid-like protein (TIGR03299 family)
MPEEMNMSDMVESMTLDVSVLGESWHGKENPFNGLMTAEQALAHAGINWQVVQAPIFVGGVEVPGFKANVRDSDRTVLGVVSDVYAPVQNWEAFSFVDSIIGSGEAKYNSAGCLFNKYQRPTRIWVSAELKPITVLGDTVKNYLVFAHSHDGLNAVKVFVTPVRVVCNNTLTMAIDGTKRFWSTKHAGDMRAKLESAQDTLKLYADYVAAFPAEAERLNEIAIYPEDAAKILDELFPDDGTSGKSRLAQNAAEMRDSILRTFAQKDDLARFRESAWGMYQAITDVVQHHSPFRNTATAIINREFRTIEGHPIVMRAQKILMRVKA